MAHINLPDLPCIRGPMAFRPETSKPLNDLAEVLLRSESTLSRGDRELIATYVSYLNDCFYCQNAHGGATPHYLQCGMATPGLIKENFETSKISEKLKSLLSIAGSVQKGGKHVTPAQIERAKSQGVTDREIH